MGTENEEQTQLLMDIFKSFDEKDRDGKFILDEFQKISVAVQTTEQKDQTETVTEQNASPVTQNIVSKAVAASLGNLDKATNYTFGVPTEAKIQSKFATLSTVDEDSLAFDDELAFEDSRDTELAFPVSKAKDEDFAALPLQAMMIKQSSTNSFCGA